MLLILGPEVIDLFQNTVDGPWHSTLWKDYFMPMTSLRQIFVGPSIAFE